MTQVRNSYPRDITKCGYGKSRALSVLANWNKPTPVYLWEPLKDNQSQKSCMPVTEHSVGKIRGQNLCFLLNIPKICQVGEL